MIQKLLLSCVILMGLADGVGAEPTGLRVIDTPHDFATLSRRIEAAVEENQMFVVTRASASAGAARRGVTIPGDMVLGVYRNDFAVRMLEASIAAGIEAPIRIHVTENDDGTASLRYKTPSSVFAPYEGGEALRALAAELDTVFAKIIEQAAAP